MLFAVRSASFTHGTNIAFILIKVEVNLHVVEALMIVFGMKLQSTLQYDKVTAISFFASIFNIDLAVVIHLAITSSSGLLPALMRERIVRPGSRLGPIHGAGMEAWLPNGLGGLGGWLPHVGGWLPHERGTLAVLATPPGPLSARPDPFACHTLVPAPWARVAAMAISPHCCGKHARAAGDGEDAQLPLAAQSP